MSGRRPPAVPLPPPPPTAIVYSRIERSVFSSDGRERPWRWRLLYAGRLDPRKGIETATRGLAELPAEATLAIEGVGGEAERARLRDLARELEVADRIERGGLRRQQLGVRYRGADVFLFPSEWEEPVGLVPLEAMACGPPVVAAGVGRSGEFLLDGHNWLLFNQADPVGMAAAVHRLADDPELRPELVAEGRRTADYFEVDHLADAFEEWYVAAGGYPDRQPASRRFDVALQRRHG